MRRIQLRAEKDSRAQLALTQLRSSLLSETPPATLFPSFSTIATMLAYQWPCVTTERWSQGGSSLLWGLCYRRDRRRETVLGRAAGS